MYDNQALSIRKLACNGNDDDTGPLVLDSAPTLTTLLPLPPYPLPTLTNCNAPPPPPLTINPIIIIFFMLGRILLRKQNWSGKLLLPLLLLLY